MYKPLLMTILILASCGRKDRGGVNKSLVTTVEKLNSPDNRYSFYRYFVEPSMAFGSGTIRMNILRASEHFDYTTPNFFTLEGAPVVLGWKDDHTLKMIALTYGEKTSTEPYKQETKTWNEFTIEIAYFHMFSAGRSPFSFSSYRIQGDSITFSDGKTSKSFVKGEVEISYNQSMFHIREIETKLDSMGIEGQKGKILVSSNSWELTPSKKFDFSAFVSKGVLIETPIE
jgi:hypothetical protein